MAFHNLARQEMTSFNTLESPIFPLIYREKGRVWHENGLNKMVDEPETVFQSPQV